MSETFCATREETEAHARRLASSLRGGEVILLDGPLGAGKTCWTRGLAEGLGFDPREVSSPTFSVMALVTRRAVARATALHASSITTLVHVDAYRMRSEEELDDLGWETWFGAPHTITVIEWASRIEAALPESAPPIRVSIDHLRQGDFSGRQIRVVRSAPPAPPAPPPGRPGSSSA